MVAMILLWMPGLTQWAKHFETPHSVMYLGYPQNGQATINLVTGKAHRIWTSESKIQGRTASTRKQTRWVRSRESFGTNTGPMVSRQK